MLTLGAWGVRVLLSTALDRACVRACMRSVCALSIFMLLSPAPKNNKAKSDEEENEVKKT